MKDNNNYVKNLRSGIKNEIRSKTLIKAKAEAISQASYEGGSLELFFNGKYYYANLITQRSGGYLKFFWRWY